MATTYNFSISKPRSYTLKVKMCSPNAPITSVWSTTFSIFKKAVTFRESDFPPIGFNVQTNSLIYRPLYFDPPNAWQYGVVGPYNEYTVPPMSEMLKPVLLPDRVNLTTDGATQQQMWSQPASYSAGVITVVFPYGTMTTAQDTFENPSMFRYYVFGRFGSAPEDYATLVEGKITVNFAEDPATPKPPTGGTINVCGVAAE